MMLQEAEHIMAQERLQFTTATAHAIGLALAGKDKVAALTQREIAEAFPKTTH